MLSRRLIGIQQKCFLASYMNEIKFYNFITENIVDMSYIFYDCPSIQIFNLTTFNISIVQDMSYMFKGMDSFNLFDLTLFSTSNVQIMSYMFKDVS